ncbi:MAG: fluoride efflux transporter CrcB [Rhizobiales bacterium]|nr:fluoride efflux transporter CrcB [Hyphomicrobiales bacterium]
MAYLIVFLGAGAGGALRHGFNVAAARAFGTGFPFGTLGVNVLGSLLMGLLAGYFAFKGDASQHWRLLLTTGVLGGFTTFSAFSLDVALLWERGDMTGTMIYLIGSVVLSIGALFAGLVLVRQLAGG